MEKKDVRILVVDDEPSIRRWLTLLLKNQYEVREAEEPKLDPAGALLRVQACGICGTDARTFFNGDPRAPGPWVLGHEPVCEGRFAFEAPGPTVANIYVRRRHGCIERVAVEGRVVGCEPRRLTLTSE